MTASTLILILFSVVLSALAQSAFKYGVSGPRVRAALDHGSSVDQLLAFGLNPYILAGLAMYGVGTILWLGVLSRLELSQAYPFVGLGFILTALLGYILFKDDFGMSRLAGTLFVLLGVYLVARG